jgi:hypothetical protein
MPSCRKPTDWNARLPCAPRWDACRWPGAYRRSHQLEAQNWVETAHDERNLRRLGYRLGRERPAHLHRLDAARTSFTAVGRAPTET